MADDRLRDLERIAGTLAEVMLAKVLRDIVEGLQELYGQDGPWLLSPDGSIRPATVKEGGSPLLPDEPVFVLRAKDAASVAGIQAYGGACAGLGAAPEHVDAVLEVLATFRAWQERNPTVVRLPD